MSVVSRVKRFFAQTIATYSEMMIEPDTDWQDVSKRMMRDMKFFNTEFSYLPNESDDEQEEKVESVTQSSTKLKRDPSPTCLAKADPPNSPPYSFNEDWEQVSSFDFDADEFKPNELFAVSPSKTEYEYDDKSSPNHKDNGWKKPGRKSSGGRRVVQVATSLDFTIGVTRIENRYRVHDQGVCAIVQKVLQEERPCKYDNVFFKCARNWSGDIQKGLVVNTNGSFFILHEGKGVFTKVVSQKDRYIYHDCFRICARKLVYCTFVKNHPGLQGESDDSYKICHINGRQYDLSIDNLALKRVRRAM